MGILYWISFDKEGRIQTVNAMDASVFTKHPEKPGHSRLILIDGKNKPDAQLYAKIDLYTGQRHYVEDGKRVKEKRLLKLSIDKLSIKPDGQDVATVTWEASGPIWMSCNGRLKQRYSNKLQIVSRTPNIYYRIAVDDPKYYSEVMWLRTVACEESAE